MTAKRFLVCALLLLWSSMAFAGMGGRGPGGGGGGGGGHGGGGGSSGGTIIDPPVGDHLSDPVELIDEDPNTPEIEVSLEVKKATVPVNGTLANLMTYNGHFPGPTIRVKKGDILKVSFKNSLPKTTKTNLLGYQRNFTNLHTHGWHVSPKPPADHVMYELAPGKTHYHEYDTSLQEAGTLSFYHTHLHGLSAEQYWAGLIGALVAEDDAEIDLLGGYETHIMIIKDIALSGTEPAPHSTMMDYMHSKEGNIVMVNGQVNPYLNMKTGQVQRWRILNGSNSRFYKLSLENHDMYLIGTDGGLLDKPYRRSTLLISPGERVDILVKGTQGSGSYRFKSLPYSRMGNHAGDTITLLTVIYNGELSTYQEIPSTINPDAQFLDPNSVTIVKERTLVLSMGQGNAYINGQDFDVNPYTIMSKVGTYEKWTISVEGGMDHPFHQHVNAGQIISVTGGDPEYASLYTSIPAWKDTVLVPKWGSVTILVPVMDYDGMAMFHCHILEHEDIGMMGVWEIMSH